MSSDQSSSQPPAAAKEVSSEPTKSVSPKSAFGISRIILLVLLLGAVAVLAWDYTARSKYHSAQAAAEDVFTLGKADPKAVHEKMGSEPYDVVETETPKRRTDYFRYPTAFYVYTIEFVYSWSPVDNAWRCMRFKPTTEPRFWKGKEEKEEE